ncbi:hypothetical protein PRIPAC_76281 [Pristionchus pacificus]|uniref:Uncharacterized protein n=1 Tax=Pristionchus pacificus TaxID=54126 RepID=A0A2A6BGC1_PRIPA|nr:hypothetical protein PRIPAC_76281 [Pristionchus pacificus]|eukprot:PDM64851.1 hypothetical protein PRIPAC_53107 [Pristionchus pacificus]
MNPLHLLLFLNLIVVVSTAPRSTRKYKTYPPLPPTTTQEICANIRGSMERANCGTNRHNAPYCAQQEQLLEMSGCVSPTTAAPTAETTTTAAAAAEKVANEEASTLSPEASAAEEKATTVVTESEAHLLSCLLVLFESPAATTANAATAAAAAVTAADTTDAATTAAAAAVTIYPPSDSTGRSPIDWSTCGTEAVCGVRASCIPGQDTSDETASLVFGSSTVDEDCTVGVWIKPLNAKEWIVKMQVWSACKSCNHPGKRQRIDPSKGMVLYHQGVTQFGCLISKGWNEITDTTIVRVSPLARTGNRSINMNPWEKSWLRPESGYCVFTIKGADRLTNLPLGETYMQYALTTGIYDSKPTNGFENVTNFLRCNPRRAYINQKKPITGYVYVRLANDLANDLKDACVRDYAKLYLLKGGKPIELSSAKCINDSTMGWTYKTTELISSKVTVHDNKYTFPAFCAVPVKTHCKMPVYQGQPEPEFSQDPDSGIVNITCKSNKWLINDKFYFIGQPECRNSLKAVDESSWWARNAAENTDVEVTSVECTEDMKCGLATNYTSDCPPQEAAQCARLLTTDGLRCPVEYNLIAVQRNGDRLQVENIECNLKKGRWVNYANATEEIDNGANIYCELQSESSHLQYSFSS